MHLKSTFDKLIKVFEPELSSHPVCMMKQGSAEVLAYFPYHRHNLNTNRYHSDQDYQMDSVLYPVKPQAVSLAPVQTGTETGVTGVTVRLQSRDLFAHAREVEIDHGGRIYRLRLTQQNKLILTA